MLRSPYAGHQNECGIAKHGHIGRRKPQFVQRVPLFVCQLPAGHAITSVPGMPPDTNVTQPHNPTQFTVLLSLGVASLPTRFPYTRIARYIEQHTALVCAWFSSDRVMTLDRLSHVLYLSVILIASVGQRHCGAASPPTAGHPWRALHLNNYDTDKQLAALAQQLPELA